MSIYEDPNGKKYRIPTDPVQRERFVSIIKEKYGEDLDQTSTLDQAIEFGKAIPRGAASLALSVPTGIVSLFDIGDDSAALKGLQGLEKSLREDSALAADPKYADKFSTKLGEGIGSFVPFLGAAKLGSVLSKTGAVSQKAGQYGVPAALAIPTGMSAQADRLNIAREMGEDVGGFTETTATLLGGAIGITEILPVAHIFSKVSKAAPSSVKKQLVSALKSGAFEGGQEVGASILQDLTARGLYSEELPIGESLFEEFTIGGIIGAGADLVVTSMAKKGIKDYHLEEKARRETLNKEELLNTKKVELGIQQGTIKEYQEPVQVNVPNIPPPDVLEDVTNFDNVQNADGTYSILNLDQPNNPVVAVVPTQTEAVIGIDKLKTEQTNKILLSQLKNILYLQGNVNSSAAFEIGQSLLDPIVTTVSANDIAVHNSRMKEAGKKKFVDANKGKTFSMPEAKKLLTKKDFNTLTEGMAQAVFKQSENEGEPSLTAGKQKLNTSSQFIKAIAESKNIDMSEGFGSVGFKHAAETFTGVDSLSKMGKGQKELLLARLHAMPKFNNKIELPNFKIRNHTAKDMADFVANIGKTEFTPKDVEVFLEERSKDKDNIDTLTFLEDLNDSGRTEFIEGKGTSVASSPRRIRDNFEFDIARRSESFGQTPEEYRATLEAENKLDPEIINQLVESERVKQEKILPPEEIEPKILNYAEAVEEGRTNKFAKEAQRILKERGLGDTGVIISDELLSASVLREVKDNEIIYDPREVKKRGIEGEYDKQSDIIFLSLNRVNPDGNLTDSEIQQKLNRLLNHEMIHALRAKDLINEQEYNYLRNQVKSKKVPASFDEKFKNKTFYQRSVDINSATLEGRELTEEKREEFFVEEAIAEMYKAKDDIKNVAPKVKGIFNKIVQFFKGMGEAMRLSGYKNVSEIFTDIESGKVGGRTRGEIRTTRELDTGVPEQALPADLAEELRQRQLAVEEPTRVVTGDPIVTTQELANLQGLTIPDPIPDPIIEPEPNDPVPVPKPEPLNEVYDSSKLTGPEFAESREFIINGLLKSGAIKKSGSNQQKGLYVGNSVEMAKWLKDNSPNEDYRIFAAKTYETLNKLEKKGFQFPLTFTSRSLQRNRSGQVAYRLSSNYFAMDINNSDSSVKNILKVESGFRDNGVDFETLLHEALHQATISNVRDYNRFKRNKTLPKEVRAPVKISKKAIRALQDLENVQDKVNDYIAEKKEYYSKIGADLQIAYNNSIKAQSKENADVVVSAPKEYARFKELKKQYRKIVLKESLTIQKLAASIVDSQLIANERVVRNGHSSFESWKNYYQDYRVNRDRSKKDLTEFITHGLTNREFQEFLEAIPYKTKTAWSEFVQSVRTLLGLPAKSNTALSAFLQSASEVVETGSDTTRATRTKEPPLKTEGDTLASRQSLEEELSGLRSDLYEARGIQSSETGQVSESREKINADRVNRITNEINFIEEQLAQPEDPEQLPLFQEGVRFEGEANTSEKIKLQKSVEEVEEIVRQTPRGGIPYYSLNASDVAIDSALNFSKDLSAKAPTDIPLWSAPTTDGVDGDIVEAMERTGGPVKPPTKSWGARLIEVAKDPITSISNFFGNFREKLIDKLDAVDKTLTKAISENEDVRDANNTADASTMAALRLADRARGVFQQLLTKGTIVSQVEGEDSLAKVVKSEDGGLIEILSPLYSRPELDQERIFKLYAQLKRTKEFLKNKRLVDSPITDADLALIEKIERQYPDVKKVFDAYQRWNNELISFAEEKGLLSSVKSNNQIINELRALSEDKSNTVNIDPAILKNLEELSQARYDEVQASREATFSKSTNQSSSEKLSLDEIVQFGQQYGIDTRGQSQIWREQSSYYPFYREMVDDSGITAPTIAGGALPNNPLSIELKGSEEAIDVDPLEAISRNSLSILTASLKNDGLAKLLRDLERVGEAKLIPAKEAGNIDSIFVFREGIKYHYAVDKKLVEGIQGIGGIGTGPIQRALALPAALLRDTVTRDPGFVVVNILRDTLSSAVTSGADFVPVKDSIVNMFRDMEDLEQYGILGGYDFSNDEGSVKQYISRTMRQQGLTPNNGLSAKDAFFKLWDGLGALTTKSDGATRLAVYDAVYKKLKNEGKTEAQAQSEAAYQALEIINFGRRGQDPLFRVITSAIPFLNARIQGLDVLYRAASGKYSAVEKLQSGESLQDVQSRILRKAILNASLLSSITLIYYLMVHDTDEYKNLKREVRDDNWVIPTGYKYSIKIPIPFEVGMLFKAIPERIFDMTLGDDAFTQKSVDEALTTTTRQLKTSLNLPFIQPGGGLQILKPLAEAINNRNSYTGQDIVPYYQLSKEAGLQARPTTNQLAKTIGEAFNISPAKIEHVLRGYTGTLGGYVLALADTLTRTATGEPLLPNNVDLMKRLPVANRLFLDTEQAGGLQQQFYELRGEVDKAVATINSLKRDQRFDELSAYRSNMKGVIGVKGQIRALERYLDNWRKRRDRLMRNENISVIAKSDRLIEMKLERDRRLAFVPELRKRAEIPVINLNL